MLKQAREAPPAQEEPETEDSPPESTEPAAEEAPEQPGQAEQPDAESEDAEGGSGWPDKLPPEMQDEFERAVTMLYDVLYKNPDTGKAVLDQIVDDEDPQVKAEAASRAAVLLVQQIDQKLDLPEDIMPYFVVTVVDRLLELAEKVKKVKFDDNDTMAVLSAAADGVRALFSGDQQQPAQPPAQGAPPPPEAAQAPPAGAA